MPPAPYTIPPELPGDPRRQAVASLRGAIYQAWCSIDEWLRLSTADEVIYLEGAEDFDIVSGNGATAVQVKHHEASISLATAQARDALENFWQLATRESSRKIRFHYLTTSHVASERDAVFGGIPGLEAWRAACTNVDMAAKVAAYLAAKLREGSSLRAFLAGGNPSDIQEQFFRRFLWLPDQPGIEVVQKSVADRIAVLLHELKRGVSLASKVQVQLEAHFWEVIRKDKSVDRRLTRADLLRQVDIATTAYLPVPLDQLPDLLGDARPGLGLLMLLKNKVPGPPNPLIPRTELVSRLEQSVTQRRVMLVTGTVFKGKTTIAQLVASNVCPEAWWLNLSGRRADQVDNVFLALAGQIEGDTCPPLIVIDDLDVGPVAHRVYRDSLALLVHRARASGRAVLMTAQGASCEVSLLADLPGIEFVDVPELSQAEVVDLCRKQGCAPTDAAFWGAAVHALSKGHPKLVQVRVAELQSRGWPRPSAADLGATSSATDSVRHIARRLLTDSMAREAVEFLYAASESSVLLHRSVALGVAETVACISNPGDLVDGLVGRWLERIEQDWFRTTPILQGAAAEAWSPERRAQVHVQLHDAILSKKALDPAEAAALLYHAFFGKEPRRIADAALKLQVISDDEARTAVEKHLLWLPYVALDARQPLCDDAVASASLRSLQFRVALKLDAETLAQIALRWSDDASQIVHPQGKEGMQCVLWGSVATADTPKLPLSLRLNAINQLGKLALTGEIAEAAASGMRAFFARSDPKSGIPDTGTTTEVVLALCTRWVRDAAALRELVQWLDLDATSEIRQEFESILSWPLVQTMGAFVQGAWAAQHESVTDWVPWLELFDLVADYAKRRSSPALGSEAAKAKAIILTEYLQRPQEALQVLSAAEASFGRSPVLDEQRANVLFQLEADVEALDVWRDLIAHAPSTWTPDPFAYRRTAISAARLKRWDEAEEIFRQAIAVLDPKGFAWTRFGLMVDCALTISLRGDQRAAAALLGEAVLAIPPTAADDGDERWEAVQRCAADVCTRLEHALWKPTNAEPKFQPGYASSPALRVPKAEPGQAMRTAMLRAQVGKLCACLDVGLEMLNAAEFVALSESPYPLVRWVAAEARLALSFARGAGEGFIEALIALDATTATFTRVGRGGLTADAGAVCDTSEHPERWFGLLVAGVCCAGDRVDDHLATWLSACQTVPGRLDRLAALIVQLQSGAAAPRPNLRSVWLNAENAAGVRCGAAAELLREPVQPGEALRLQGFLTSALVSDGSFTCQEVFNYHVAMRFAVVWEHFAQNSFVLISPRTVVPILRAAINRVERESGTLRSLLSAVSEAVGQPLGEFMDRVR